MNARTILIATFVAVAIIGGLMWYTRSTVPTPTGSDEDTSGLIVSENAIYVADQSPAQSISVSVVRLEKPGFVAIHEDAEGEPGKILGASNLLPTGETKDLPAIDLSRATRDGETLYAVLHLDDGSGVFEESKDAPAVDPTEGEPIMMIFYAFTDAAGPDEISL